MSIFSHIAKTGITATLLGLMIGGISYAGGDIKEVRKRECSPSANIAITSDYVFRGISQTQEDPAVQGGFDLECGIIYAGVWGSNVDFGNATSAEFDLYIGIKPTIRSLNFDFGIIAYLYDNPTDEIYEGKIGVSGEVYKGATLGATAYIDLENDIQTYEIGFEKSVDRKVGPFSPSISTLVGFVEGSDATTEYVFWNAGVATRLC